MSDVSRDDLTLFIITNHSEHNIERTDGVYVHIGRILLILGETGTSCRVRYRLSCAPPVTQITKLYYHQVGVLMSAALHSRMSGRLAAVHSSGCSPDFYQLADDSRATSRVNSKRARKLYFKTVQKRVRRVHVIEIALRF